MSDNDRLRTLVITDPTRAELSDIRLCTRGRYGAQGLDAHDALIRQALHDLRTDPLRAGSRVRAEELGIDGLCSYHLAMSRKRTDPVVKRPRHLFLYIVPNEGRIAILRILYDTRDLIRHLPPRGDDAL